MAKIDRGACWGVIPARGGSKSVPLKNLADLAGRPLIDYVALAAGACGAVSRLVCSTDSEPIAARCRTLGVEVRPRPPELARDETPVFDAVNHLLADLGGRDGALAEFVALLQPTSPFLLPGHIAGCVEALDADAAAGSAQTVVPCPHNHHALNQRVVADGRVRFRYPEERKAAYNKQSKPPHWLFGNLLVFRAEAALAQRTLFAEPSLAVPIEPVYGFDADGPEDFRLGDLLVRQGFVALPHLAAARGAGSLGPSGAGSI